VDAKALLRQYLEQRRELGESEFMLDGMTVEEAMRLIGVSGAIPPTAPSARPPSASPTRAVAERPASRAAPPEPAPRRTRDGSDDGDTDWRAALRAAGVAPTSSPSSGSAPPAVPAPPPSVEVAPLTDVNAAVSDEPPAGAIHVGTAERELFTGPVGAVDTLDELATLIRACQACRLHAEALNAVPGEGDPHAEFVVVGEAPGAKEDESGRPFIGRSGDLLTKILEAVQLPRDQVFICNVIKHRPPENRNPSPDEIAACRPFLRRQLEILRPRVILALGTFAAQTLLDTKVAIGKLRGFEHSYYGVPLVVTYHPAALLRNPAWKRPTWEDVQFARRILDRPRRDG
jgi:DNA polymerase